MSATSVGINSPHEAPRAALQSQQEDAADQQQGPDDRRADHGDQQGRVYRDTEQDESGLDEELGAESGRQSVAQEGAVIRAMELASWCCSSAGSAQAMSGMCSATSA